MDLNSYKTMVLREERNIVKELPPTPFILQSEYSTYIISINSDNKSLYSFTSLTDGRCYRSATYDVGYILDCINNIGWKLLKSEIKLSE